MISSRFIRKLETLDLSRTNVGNKGLSALDCSQALGRLVNLPLSGTSINDKGVLALSSSKHLTNLKRLSENTITSCKGLNALASSNALHYLVELLLSETGVDDAGTTSLSASRIMKKLEALDLSSTQGSDGDCVLWIHLMSYRSIKEVKYLGNHVFVDEEFEMLFRDTLRFRLLHSARNGMRARQLDMRTLTLVLDHSCTDRRLGS